MNDKKITSISIVVTFEQAERLRRILERTLGDGSKTTEIETTMRVILEQIYQQKCI